MLIYHQPTCCKNLEERKLVRLVVLHIVRTDGIKVTTVRRNEETDRKADNVVPTDACPLQQ